MPITKSAKKALRQNKKRRTRNVRVKKEMKALLDKTRDLTLQNKIKEAQALLPQLYKRFDKAAKIGLIKKNAAARKKSRVALFLQKHANPGAHISSAN